MNRQITNEQLILIAKKYQKNAMAKYSKFSVGAALLDYKGQVHGGCNIESSSYSLTICAERVALTKALSEGVRTFRKIAIVGPHEEFCPPCGACRQLLHDYASQLEIILTDNKNIKLMNLKDLIPLAFEEKNLKTI